VAKPSRTSASLAHAHADAAAAGRGLEHDRIADRGRCLDGFVLAGQQVAARRQRHAVGLGQFARAVLEAEGADIVRRRPDEHDPFGRAGIGEFDVFGQEAIAGVDRPGAGCLGRRDDRGDVEIAFAGARRADAHGLVRQGDMGRSFVRLRIDRHRAQAHLAQGADDASGDRAAIGDEDSVEHHAATIMRTGWD
jgi:hypothetical protein